MELLHAVLRIPLVSVAMVGPAFTKKFRFRQVVVLMTAGLVCWSPQLRAEWTCGVRHPEVTTAEWSFEVLATEQTSLSSFMQNWLQDEVDTNRDGKVSPAEHQQVICKMTGALRQKTGSSGPLITPDGRVDWLSYLASDQKVSNFELKFAIGLYAEKWNLRLLLETPIAPDVRERFLQMLAANSWGVSQKDPAEQEDLLGKDVSVSARITKQTVLAERLSALKVKSDQDFATLLELFADISSQQKNIPWIQSVKPKVHVLQVAFNQAMNTEIGQSGVRRFYVLHGVSVRLQTGEKARWYQPAEQSTFTLVEASAFPSTEAFLHSVEQKLKGLCRTPGRIFQIAPEEISTLNAQGLQVQIQKAMNSLSETFALVPLKVIVSTEPLKDGSTAYLDRHEGTISFSYDLLAATAKELVRRDFNRQMTTLVVHEFLHYLQAQSPDYEMAFRMYNSPGWANFLYGEYGYRQYYLAQPTERDAQALAGTFTKALENDCQGLN